MRKTKYISLVILLAAIFAITGFNFEDPSFQENSKEYMLLILAVIFGTISLIMKLSKK